jgi:META domain
MRWVTSIVAWIAIFAALAVLILTAPPSSGDLLTGSTWQWTATTTAQGVAPSSAPDPSLYTVDFGRDGTFRAKADCTEATGTYRVIPGGRMGPRTGLVITPAPGALAACGAGSLSEAFVTDLDRAVGYQIVDGLLTISLADGSRMTFR